jgi:hypothetical protein
VIGDDPLGGQERRVDDRKALPKLEQEFLCVTTHRKTPLRQRVVEIEDDPAQAARAWP